MDIFYYYTLGSDFCTCNGKMNKHGEGASCKPHSGYRDGWYNSVWCYADVNTCPDAKLRPILDSSDSAKYGASKEACCKYYTFPYVSGIYSQVISKKVKYKRTL